MRLFTSILILAASLIPIVAVAQVETRMTTITFTNGCKLEWPRKYYESKLLNEQASFTWTGDCVAGLAQGLGTLTEVSKYGYPNKDDAISIKDEKTFFHEGRPFGYSLGSVRQKKSKEDSARDLPKYWIFRGNDKEVGFSAEGSGLMLDIEPFGMSTPIPTLTATLITTWTLNSHTRGVSLIVSNCSDSYTSSMPFCKDKGSVPVYYISEHPIPVKMLSDFTSTPCPDPHNPSGCEGLIARASLPVRQEILAFIERSRAVNDSMVASMNAKPQEERDRAAATKQKLAEEEIAFRSDLQRMNPGQLFALADKSLADGNVSKAREALRALIERFPDHPLAATASQQLAGLSMRSGAPGKATSGDTKGESTRVESGAASPVVQSPSADAAKAQHVRQVQEQSQRQAEAKAEWQSAAQAIANGAALLDSQRRAGGGAATVAGSPGASPQEVCRCGPDYIGCWERNARARGGDVSTTRNGTEHCIIFWDTKSRGAQGNKISNGNRCWNSRTNVCDGIGK